MGIHVVKDPKVARNLKIYSRMHREGTKIEYVWVQSAQYVKMNLYLLDLFPFAEVMEL